MEHYRRLGFSEQIRSLGLPPEYPSDIAYFTRYGGRGIIEKYHELFPDKVAAALSGDYRKDVEVVDLRAQGPADPPAP